jgi:hypothetical protein
MISPIIILNVELQVGEGGFDSSTLTAIFLSFEYVATNIACVEVKAPLS